MLNRENGSFFVVHLFHSLCIWIRCVLSTCTFSPNAQKLSWEFFFLFLSVLVVCSLRNPMREQSIPCIGSMWFLFIVCALWCMFKYTLSSYEYTLLRLTIPIFMTFFPCHSCAATRRLRVDEFVQRLMSDDNVWWINTKLTAENLLWKLPFGAADQQTDNYASVVNMLGGVDCG